MRDKKNVMEVLYQIEEAAAKIFDRFQIPNQMVDFTDSPAGVDNVNKE